MDNSNKNKQRPSVKSNNKHFKVVSGNKKIKVKNTIDSPVITQTRTLQASAKHKKHSTRAQANNNASGQIMNAQIKSHSTKRATSKTNPQKPKRNNAKKITIIVIIAIAICLSGVIAGIVGFMLHTSSSIAVPSETKKALSRTQDNTPVYMLYAASTEQNSDEYNILLLCRADFSDKQVMIISIPTDTYVASASGGAATLKEISNKSGDAALIEAVSSFSDVGINYFVKMNAEGIVKTVDAFDGIDVNLKEEIDDPSAGKIYIPSGESHINGEGALTLLRSKNLTNSSTYYDNQRQFAKGLCYAVFGEKSKDMAGKIDILSNSFKTSMSVNELLEFSDKLYGIDKSNILDDTVPGSRTLRENRKVFIVDATAWKNMRTNMGYGMLSDDEEDVTVEDINPGSFTIQIQNGTTVEGAANMLANTLRSQGYNVVETGNADATIYKETIIIYSSDEMKKNAQAVKNSINNGRLVQSNGMYNLKTDILIIIGADLTI